MPKLFHRIDLGTEVHRIQEYISFYLDENGQGESLLMRIKQVFKKSPQMRAFSEGSGVLIMSTIVFFPSFVQSGY